MRILITGVAGFIGSNLAQALLKREYQVVGVDNMSQGEELNLEGFITHPAFEMHYVDVRNCEAVLSAASDCEAIVHLAAFKIPRYGNALETLQINSQGCHAVAKAAIQNGAKVITASTSDVYGKNKEIPFKETAELVMGNPDVKRWAYAISKMFEEQVMFAYAERYGIDFVILRFFGGYGPNQKLTWWGGPQSVFINCTLDNKEMEIHGDGKQTRSFTYVSDHVEGIIRAIENPKTNKMVLNLGNTHEISILDLARLIWQLIRRNEEPKIRFIPYSSFGKYEDVKRRIPDISKAREILGFEPLVELEYGLKKTILWQIERRREIGIPTPDLEV